MKRRRKKSAARRAIHLLVARLREERGLSQQQLADVLGIDKTAVSHWETGLSAPKRDRIPALAEALGVSVDRFFDAFFDDGREAA